MPSSGRPGLVGCIGYFTFKIVVRRGEGDDLRCFFAAPRLSRLTRRGVLSWRSHRRHRISSWSMRPVGRCRSPIPTAWHRLVRLPAQSRLQAAPDDLRMWTRCPTGAECSRRLRLGPDASTDGAAKCAAARVQSGGSSHACVPACSPTSPLRTTEGRGRDGLVPSSATALQRASAGRPIIGLCALDVSFTSRVMPPSSSRCSGQPSIWCANSPSSRRFAGRTLAAPSSAMMLTASSVEVGRPRRATGPSAHAADLDPQALTTRARRLPEDPYWWCRRSRRRTLGLRRRYAGRCSRSPQSSCW